MDLVWPAMEYLPGLKDALERDWSPNTLRPETAREELARLLANPELYVAQQVDRQGEGPRVILPDGSTVPRLPGYTRWLWDGEFCGSINLRWLPNTTALPPHCLGHIGYSVVPWKRGRGYATRALAILLSEIDEPGLDFVDLTTNMSNVASRKVIEANNGVLVERFSRPAEYGGGDGLRYRITLRHHNSS